MSAPITVDLPHQLGKAGARARMEAGAGKLASFVPGGRVTEHRWEDDTMIIAVEAFAQRVGARMTVTDTHVHAVFDLPPLLAAFAEKIRGKLQKDGAALLK